MLIAIMGDAFDYATEKREDHRKEGMLRIMGEYVHLTVQGGDKSRPDDFKVCEEDEFEKTYG